jgi:hypothetical protein
LYISAKLHGVTLKKTVFFINVRCLKKRYEENIGIAEGGSSWRWRNVGNEELHDL